MTEEAVVDVVAVVLDPEPNPKRPVGLKELFEFFDEALSLVIGGGLDVEATGLTAFEEEGTGMLVGFDDSVALVPAPFQTFFTRFLADDRNPNLEVVPLFSNKNSSEPAQQYGAKTHSLRWREMGDQHSFAAQLR